MELKLSKEYNFGGKKYKELNIDIENLTGKDIIQAEKEFKARMKGEQIYFQEMETPWAITLAAKAAGLKYGDLLELRATDFNKIVAAVKGFLLKDWADSPMIQTESKEG